MTAHAFLCLPSLACAVYGVLPLSGAHSHGMLIGARLQPDAVPDSRLYKNPPKISRLGTFVLQAVSKRFDSREAYPEDMDPAIAAREYDAFVDGLKAIGFNDELVAANRRLLAGILYIGNIDFAEVRDGTLKLTSYSSLYRACELLGLPAVPLGTALCTYTTVTRGETIARELTKEQARDVRDATAKALYNRLFTFVIKRVNSHGVRQL